MTGTLAYAVCGALLAIGLLLAGSAVLLVKQTMDTEYHWQPEPSLEDRRHCASAGSMPDCFRTLGYKWEKVNE